MQQLFSKFFSIFFFSKINRILTEFFLNIKKLPKLFPNFFFEKFFLRKFFSINFFFGENYLYRILFGENFSFYKNISAKIFFTIYSRISFVFDVCETMYFAKFFIRNFAYCEFFRFAILVDGNSIFRYKRPKRAVGALQV